MSHNPVRPMSKPPNQGTSASFEQTIAQPYQPDYPHDTFKSTPTPEFNTSITAPGAGTHGESGVVRKIRPRC